jgi:ubiquinone/menaquinone biosynthesis C-methylase UbiE
MNTTTLAAPDYTVIKERQRAMWASGDYARIGTTLQLAGEALAEAIDMTPGSKVLDVAAGNGNASLAMARRGCKVTSTDYVEALLERGRMRAEAESLDIEFRMADAEALPFGAGSFDAAVSVFGVMFAPDQAEAAAELLRVVRSGGKIGLANWTPEGFIGQLLKTVGRHVPPPKGLDPPPRWGAKAWIEETFGREARALAMEARTFTFRYASPQEFVDFFRTYYGPTHKAFLALDRAGQAALENDMVELVARFNRAGDGAMAVPSDYLETIVTRR